MDLGLQNKTVVVTGGSSGIGLATVRALLAEGANVALCARGAERLSSVITELMSEFGKARVISSAFSVLDQDAVSAFANDVGARFGGCDALVTNAGQGRVSTFANTSDDDWREELDLKFFSQLYPIRAFEPLLGKARAAQLSLSILCWPISPNRIWSARRLHALVSRTY